MLDLQAYIDLEFYKEKNWCEGDDIESKRCTVVKKTKWLLSMASNCIVVMLVSLAAWILVNVNMSLRLIDH